MALVAILYDIHGNLPALEEVLREAEEAGADRYLLGGDYAAPEPMGSATLARLRELEHATWIRGNGERWLTEPPEDVPEIGREHPEAVREPLLGEAPKAQSVRRDSVEA